MLLILRLTDYVSGVRKRSQLIKMLERDNALYLVGFTVLTLNDLKITKRYLQFLVAYIVLSIMRNRFKKREAVRNV